MKQPPEDAERFFMIQRHADVEFDVPPRVGAMDVEDTQGRPGYTKRPAGLVCKPQVNRVPPHHVGRFVPPGDNHDSGRMRAGMKNCIKGGSRRAERDRREPESPGQWLCDEVVYMPWPARGAHAVA